MYREVDRPEVHIPAVYIRKCEQDDYMWKSLDEIACSLCSEEDFHEVFEDPTCYEKCAIISPVIHSYVNEVPGDENREMINAFEKELAHYDLHRFRFLCEYGGEDVFFIKGISLEDAYCVAKKYNQYTFIYKDVDGCREFCAKPLTGADGRTFKLLDIVKHYELYPYGAYNTSDFANMIYQKTKTVEVAGMEKGNSYEPKSWYELYYISPPYPKYKPPAPIGCFIRRMQLVESWSEK